MMNKNGLPLLTDSYLAEIVKGQIACRRPPLGNSSNTPGQGKHGDVVVKYRDS